MAQSVTPLYARAVGTASWAEVIQARKDGTPWHELRTNTGLSALGRAVVDNDFLIVEQLLNLGAPTHPIQLFNETWFSPLWESLEREDPNVLHILLKAGANPNEPNSENSLLKPLHKASEMGQIQATLFLCEAGADPNGLPKNEEMIKLFFTTLKTPIQYWVEHLSQNFVDIRPFMKLLKMGANPTLPAPPHENLWELVQDKWSFILAQKQNHPQVGVALSALEKAMLEWEMPTGKEEKGSKRI